MQNTENKTKRFVVLATYVAAVLCLLAGLFLPLFNGKDILALQLPEVFKSLLSKGNTDAKYPFTLPYVIRLFGIESLEFDFMALVIVLYTAVTALALLAFIPVAFSVRKQGKAAKKIYYAIEIAAIIVLALYFTSVTVMMIANTNAATPYDKINNVGYNMVTALSGTALALLVLCGLDKGKNAAIKIVLFLLSAIGFAALFDAGLLSEKLAAPFNGKLSSAMADKTSGADWLSGLFAKNISNLLADGPDLKNKILLMLGVITATVALLNLFIDTVKLATRKDGNFGRIFDFARFGLEVVGAAGVLVMALVCKATLGLMLIVILAVAALQLIIAIIRFIAGIFKKHDEKPVVAEAYDEPIHNVIDIDAEDEYKAEEPAQKFYDDGYTSPEDDGYRLPEEDYVEPVSEPEPEPVAEAINEEPAETVEEATEEASEQPEPVPEPEPEPVTEPAKEEPEEEITRFYEPEEDTSYLLPVEQPAEEHAEETEEPETVVVEDETKSEEVAVEVVEAEKVEEPNDGLEELVQKPYHEEIKPYNPYERHNNPFRAYEQSSQPVQPYNPYAQQQTAKPVQPVHEQKPVQHTYEKPVEQKPVQTYKSYEPAAERPQSVRPLQPRPIIQEFKPVPPISEQPPKEPHVYTIDTIYAGPTDDFIRKLSNDERIEFARTFIEKNRGDLGSIPDYIVGGDNKKFFSVAFIYLGRIRGLVSDGLLNKMYKELNLL